MNSKIKAMMALCGAALAVSESKTQMYLTDYPKVVERKPKYDLPKEKELHEFKINGKSVMAYSRKDAIKRLKHENK